MQPQYILYGAVRNWPTATPAPIAPNSSSRISAREILWNGEYIVKVRQMSHVFWIICVHPCSSVA